mmetsp:Transcript_14645/g.21598  ORF Transcript_14645/g.21598 Transcript_14645/m.21598 type:complete len:186 (+) Transcript_14645:83-640(+)|eukprot:CAMPEP_0194245118 /NCGR_PEP_ID=MMETSP0158-20130606/12604_1 /TAXON_ID=33649 /ORGANISM="Thalassionema nitzschioides, Strain L26-B" /LENGTH=185 /DNA_ID=CAMNT_0038980755 /DNA_START=77 /DNA_END=634 /DNA_ORIENTATION=+
MTNLSKILALGAGCYWGTEKYVVKDFQQRFPNSIASASVGFMSPDQNAVANPSYEYVCTGSTGHVEVLRIEFNDPEKYFEELIKFFFMFHDPTTKNRQGNDVGTQYASWIFVGDDEQSRISSRVKDELQQMIDSKKVSYFGNTITTEISPMNEFYPAHEEHQEYLMKNPNGYCNHQYHFSEWPLL